MTFVDSSYRNQIRLDSVTCVVDADQILADDDPDIVDYLDLFLEDEGYEVTSANRSSSALSTAVPTLGSASTSSRLAMAIWASPPRFTKAKTTASN